MRITFSLFLTALLAVTPCLAATWVVVGGNDTVVVKMDSDSLRRNGNQAKAWLKWEWVKPVDLPNTYPPKTYLLERQLLVTDCKNNTFAVAQVMRYADLAAYEVVETHTFEQKSWQFLEVAPDTISETVVKHVCKASQKRK